MTASTSPEGRLGSLLIEDQVFQGASSEVFRCWDPLVERHVAVKRARVDGDHRQRNTKGLWQEARIRGSLDHPNVLPLYFARRSRSGPYLVGPWLPGGSLGDRFRYECLPRALLLRVVTTMTSALDRLHASGLVHGDLHWGNILLADAERPMLIDFASARPVGERWCEAGQPARLQVMPHIVAPEVWRGESVDGRADLYSLGAVIFRGLVGMYPFDADDLKRIPAMHCEVPIPSFADSTPGVGVAMESVVRRCLAKNPDTRYATGAALAEAFLDAFRADGGSVPSTRQRPAMFSGPSVPAANPSQSQGSPAHSAGEAGARPTSGAESQARGRALQEVSSLTTQLFAVPAAMLALEDIGATLSMARGANTPGDIAAACGAPENTVLRLLEALWKAGFVGEKGGQYFLPPPLVTAYQTSSAGATENLPIRLAADFWGHLSRWVLTYEPFRSMDQRDGGRYSSVVGVLGRLFAQRAHRLAEQLHASGDLPSNPAILDVGAGSAVWSFALAGQYAAATVTAVDRPKVLQVTGAAAEAVGLAERFTALAGDWRDVSLPEGAFDVAFLANLCHLEAGPDVAHLFGRLVPAIREGGVLVVVDTIPEDRDHASLSDCLYGLRMGLRSSKGDLHTLAAYRAWLRQTGLEFVTSQRLDATGPGLSAIIARRPAARNPA